jgi:hypothetical protein
MALGRESTLLLSGLVSLLFLSCSRPFALAGRFPHSIPAAVAASLQLQVCRSMVHPFLSTHYLQQYSCHKYFGYCVQYVAGEEGGALRDGTGGDIAESPLTRKDRSRLFDLCDLHTYMANTWCRDHNCKWSIQEFATNLHCLIPSVKVFILLQGSQRLPTGLQHYP